MLQSNDMVWSCEDAFCGTSWLSLYIGEGRVAAAILQYRIQSHRAAYTAICEMQYSRGGTPSYLISDSCHVLQRCALPLVETCGSQVLDHAYSQDAFKTKKTRASVSNIYTVYLTYCANDTGWFALYTLSEHLRRIRGERCASFRAFQLPA